MNNNICFKGLQFKHNNNDNELNFHCKEFEQFFNNIMEHYLDYSIQSGELKSFDHVFFINDATKDDNIMNNK